VNLITPNELRSDSNNGHMTSECSTDVLIYDEVVKVYDSSALVVDAMKAKVQKFRYVCQCFRLCQVK